MRKIVLLILILTVYSNANSVYSYVKSRIESAAICTFNNADASVDRVTIDNAKTLDSVIIVTGTVYLKDISSKGMKLFGAMTNTQVKLSRKFRAKFTKVLDSVALNCFAELDSPTNSDKYCNESSRQITHQKPFLWGMLKIFRA